MAIRSIIAVPASLSLALALAACGASETTEADTAEADTAVEASADVADDGAGAMDGAADTSAAADTAAPASDTSAIMTLNATCPGDIEFHADEGGPTYVNGNEADLEVFNENYYEASGDGVTISVSSDAGANPSVSYTGPGGANGICQVS